MLSLNATQLAIVASNYKKVSWLFTVVDSAGSTTYYWSTITRSYGGHDYVYKIDPTTFRGITLNSTNPIYGIISPTDLSFAVENSGNILTASNFIGGTVTLDLVIADKPILNYYTDELGGYYVDELGDKYGDEEVNEEIICSWKFNIKRCEAGYQTLSFTCEDFVQKYLEGDYPNTRLVKDIIPSNDPDIDDELCVPVLIGECYTPLRSLYIVDQRYYLLGLATGNVYDITKVRSPRSWPHRKSEWESGSYSFNKSTKTIDTVDWRVFQAIICDDDGDNVADSNGLWQQGDSYLDMPVQFTKDNTRYISGDQTGAHDGANNVAVLTDTGATWGVDKLIGAYVVNKTDGSYGKITDNTATTVTATLAGGIDNDWDIGDNYTVGGPASCIKFVFEGITSFSKVVIDIDDTSFGIAEKTFAGWGLTFNGVYDHKKPADQVLAQLLVMCHSTLQFTDKIGLHVLSKTSQKTITKADVLRTSKTGPGTFKYSLITQKQSDSGYIEFQVADESQDKFIKKLVLAKASTDSISSEILNIPFVQDTQDVQRIGTLYYQRKFTPKANISFTNKGGTLLALQPDDVATVNHADYGGNYPVVVKSMTIKHDLSIALNCVQYSVALDDWTDLSPSVISIGQDDSTVVFNAAGNRVFPVQPYPPYDVGDLWVGGPSGDIKRCSTARASGAYQAGDWELASEYDNTANVHQIFRVVSKGWTSTSHPRTSALLNEAGTVLKVGSRSYNVSILDRATRTWDSHTTYDVYDDSDTKEDLHSAEVNGVGTTAIASQVFTPVDCTGLTKANGTLIIDLKCTDWSKFSALGQLEISSSGIADTNEWYTNPASDLSITSEWKTFNIPLSDFITVGGEVDVTDIKRLRWYANFSESETIYWRNAKIHFGDANGPRAMADALYALDSSKIVAIFTNDEPKLNRLESNLDTQMYRCGAIKTIYGSDNFKHRSAYCLIGIPGVGQGNGLELYSGDVGDDPDAWIDTTFTIDSQGNIGLSSINVRDAVDISYQDGTLVEDLQPAAAGADVALDQLSGKGPNVCHARYSSFEEANKPPTVEANGTVTQSSATAFFGGNSLKMAASAADHFCYLGLYNTTYNVKITPNKKWIISAYVYADAVSKSGQFYIKTSDGNHSSPVDFTTTAAGYTWKRVSGVIDLSSNSSTTCIIRLDNDGGNGVAMYWDGIMLEEQQGNLEVPSVYVLPSGIISGWDSQADETSTNTAADITGQGDLATTNEADANVLNMTNAPAEAGADVTTDHVAQNLQYNGDFELDSSTETNPTHWVRAINGTPLYAMVWATTPESHWPPWKPGGHCFYANCDDIAEHVRISSDYYIPVSQDSYYCLNTWIKTYNSNCFLGVLWYDKDYNYLSTDYVCLDAYQNTHAWEQKSSAAFKPSDYEATARYVLIDAWVQYQRVGWTILSHIQFVESKTPVAWEVSYAVAPGSDVTGDNTAADATVYTGSSLGTVTTGVLQNAAGTFSLNLTTGKLTVNLADGLEITASGGVKVTSGGDITWLSTASDIAAASFQGPATQNSRVSFIGADKNSESFLILPIPNGEVPLRIGNYTQAWENVKLIGKDFCVISPSVTDAGTFYIGEGTYEWADGYICWRPASTTDSQYLIFSKTTGNKHLVYPAIDSDMYWGANNKRFYAGYFDNLYGTLHDVALSDKICAICGKAFVKDDHVKFIVANVNGKNIDVVPVHESCEGKRQHKTPKEKEDNSLNKAVEPPHKSTE